MRVVEVTNQFMLQSLASAVIKILTFARHQSPSQRSLAC